MMSDLIIYLFAALLALFSGFISVLFLRDVFLTLKAWLQNDRNVSRLTRWQMFYHVFIGILTGLAALLLLFGSIFIIVIRRNHP